MSLLIILWLLFELDWLWIIPWVMFTPAAVVLAIVLIFLVIAVLLALVPIRYQAKASTGEAGHTARIKVTYMFGLLSFWFVYKDGEARQRICLAGRTIWGTKKKPPPESSPKPTEPKPYVPQKIELEDTDEIVPKVERTAPVKPPLIQRFQNIKNQIYEIVHHPDRKRIPRWIWRAVKKTIKRLKPKRIEIAGSVGFADPATTAQLVGGINVFAIIWQWQDYIRVKPKFDIDTTEINLCINVKGSISIAKIASPTLWLGIKLGVLMLFRKIQNKITRKGKLK